MAEFTKPDAVIAKDVPANSQPSNYPPEFAKQVKGRTKRALGDFFGLKNFGVNYTILAPHSKSALFHKHALQDEFIYIISGSPELRTESGITKLEAGMVAGFVAGGEAHQLLNNSDEDVVYLEVGDRTAGDAVEYPDDDIAAFANPKGGWMFKRKDGSDF